MDAVKKYIFTFGVGTPFKGRYVEIEGTYNEAREAMFDMFGSKWAFQYAPTKGAELIARFGYKQLDVSAVSPKNPK